MTEDKYYPSIRTVYSRNLEREIAPEVWRRLGGNGSLRINIDTDVNCYGEWDPWGPREDDGYDNIREVQSWVAYFVRSTINRLIDRGDLAVRSFDNEGARLIDKESPREGGSNR